MKHPSITINAVVPLVDKAGYREPNPRIRRREKNVLDIPSYRSGHYTFSPLIIERNDEFSPARRLSYTLEILHHKLWGEDRMLGAIAGDIIGSVHEFLGGKAKEFSLFVEDSRFTDDTVLSIAVAHCLLTGVPYVDTFRTYAQKYPDRCYGMSFWRWVESGSREPYGSWGNGSAMRVAPVAFAFESLEEVLGAARASAEVTHNHPEGIRGAQATAAATFLARQHATKEQIREEIETRFGYSLLRTIDMIRPSYTFNESCQQTVPEAITAVLDSTGYEDAVRLAISLGGDADTLACIAGGIAGAMYGVPNSIATRALALLDDDLRKTVARFCQTYTIALP